MLNHNFIFPYPNCVNIHTKMFHQYLPIPRFNGVHLFAYRTTLADVYRFVASLDDRHIHVVRADTFLRVAIQSQQ